MSTDFFDDDLVKPAEPGQDLQEPAPRASDSPPRAESTYDRKRQELSQGVEGTSNELERLRQRQEDLERQKEALQSLKKKQEDYERGRRDMLEKLERSVVLLKKEEGQASRMVTLFAETHKRFGSLLSELKAIKHETWAPGDFDAELTRALATVDAAQSAYSKGLDRVNATNWQRDDVVKSVVSGLQGERPPTGVAHSFWGWVKVGVALTIPLAIGAILVVLVVFYLMGYLPS